MKINWRDAIIGGCLPVLFASSALWTISGSHDGFGWRYWIFYVVCFALLLWAFAIGADHGFNKGWDARERKPINRPSSVPPPEPR